MALITLTPADMRLGTGTTCSQGIAGETITPFQWLYLKAGDGKYWKAINTTAAEATIVGVALTYAAGDQEVAFAVINPGTSYLTSASANWVKGLNYVVGSVAGQLSLPGDLTAGMFHTIGGVAASTTSLLLYNTNSGLIA